jgi:hypothetical protein
MMILDSLPILGVYVLTVVLVLAAAEAGFRIGLTIHRREPSDSGSSMRGAVVGSLLGLMAFLMAFSIGIVINQHNNRKAMVVTEANAVGTAWLRAGFLSEPDLSTTRDLLREYVEVRLEAASDISQFNSMVARSEEIHVDLWSIVEQNVGRGNTSDIMALFADSINTVIDVHLLRITAATLRLPRLFGIVLYASTLISFFLVGVASSSDGKRDTAAIVLFALAFVAVMMIIIDLDRPQGGLLRVSQDALTSLLQQMTAQSQ